jgi:hypothetical protein
MMPMYNERTHPLPVEEEEEEVQVEEAVGL